MRPFTTMIFARQKYKPNTFIGGISSTHTTAAHVASRLGISVARIKSFSIVGSDVQFAVIGGTYSLPLNAFSTNTLVTSYIDNDGLMIGIGNASFSNASNFANLYAPRCVSLGTSCFYSIKSSATLLTDAFLRTSNSGTYHFELLTAYINRNAILSFRFDTPTIGTISNLAVGNIYDERVQITFTAPSSTYLIDFYEVTVNGSYWGIVGNSNGYITGLTASTNYNIQLKSVDVFGNKSAFSNTLNVSTNTTAIALTSKLAAYYRLNSDLVDQVAGNTGVGVSATYVSGKSGDAFRMNGSTSWANIGNLNSLKFSTGSISAYIMLDTPQSNTRYYLSKPRVFNITNNSAGRLILCNGVSTGITMTLGVWYHVVMTFSERTNTVKCYVDGVLRLTTTAPTLRHDLKYCIGASTELGAPGSFPNGAIDGTGIWNSELTASEVLSIFNTQNAGNELL